MAVLCTILLLIPAVCGAVVLLSYTIAWYEYANRDATLLQRRFVPRTLASVACCMALETALLTLTVLLHPCGWLPAKVKPPTKPAPPVLLLHGLFHNKACWLWLRLALRLRGFSAVYTMNLPPWKEIESLTEDLAKKVDEIRHGLGYDQVALVGHSMGAMIARNYLQLRGGAGKVSHLVLLGSPNTGSKLAPFAVSPLGKLLLPGSAFLQRLGAAPLPAEVPVTCIYSRKDNMVIPFENARLEGARGIELDRLGHASLLYAPRAIAAVMDGLSQGEPS